MTMWGFVLANVAPGKEPEFFSNLGTIEQVRHVFYLFEDYEYLLEVEANSTQELTKVLTNHIRHLPGVERTASYIEGNALEFSPVEKETDLDAAHYPTLF
jgi:DNA-binding Lrp family transcriptional regulator